MKSANSPSSILQGSLYDYLHDPKRVVDWKFRIYIASDIARAMQFLHQTVPPIVHRDLKSPNILLTCPEVRFWDLIFRFCVFRTKFCVRNYDYYVIIATL